MPVPARCWTDRPRGRRAPTRSPPTMGWSRWLWTMLWRPLGQLPRIPGRRGGPGWRRSRPPPEPAPRTTNPPSSGGRRRRPGRCRRSVPGPGDAAGPGAGAIGPTATTSRSTTASGSNGTTMVSRSTSALSPSTPQRGVGSISAADRGTPYRWYGLYTQRPEEDRYFMMRVRVPNGLLTAEEVGAVGLTSRQTCGNVTRNIMGCPLASVAGDEILDPTRMRSRWIGACPAPRSSRICPAITRSRSPGAGRSARCTRSWTSAWSASSTPTGGGASTCGWAVGSVRRRTSLAVWTTRLRALRLVDLLILLRFNLERGIELARRAADTVERGGRRLHARHRHQTVTSRLGHGVLDHRELGPDVDTPANGARDRAPRRMGVVGPFDSRPIGVGRHPQLVTDVDALDDEHLVLDLDLTHSVTPETTASGGDLARLERAPERARQSARGRRHHIVKGRGVRLVTALGGAVVRGDRPMHTKDDRTILRRDLRIPQRACGSFNLDFGSVHDLAHLCSSSVDRRSPCRKASPTATDSMPYCADGLGHRPCPVRR